MRDTAILAGVGSIFTFIKPLRAIIIGRILGPYDYGLFNIPLPYIQLFSIFANMGLSAAMLRLISVKLGQKDRASALAVYRTGMSAALVSSVIWSIVLCALAPLLAKRFASEPDATVLIIIGAWMIPGVTLTAVLSNIFLAFGRGPLLGLVRSVYSILALIIPLALVVMFRQPLHVLLAFVLVELAGALIASILLHKKVARGLPARAPAESAQPGLGTLLRLAHSFFYTNLGWMVINSVDRIMIQRYCATEILGFYAVAVFFVNFLNIIPMNFSQVITPGLTKALTRDAKEQAWDTLRRTTRIVSLILAPLVVFCCVFSQEIVTLLFSGDFAAAGVFLKILALVVLFNFICKLTWSIIVSDSAPGARSLAYVFAAVLNIALNLILIPRFGGAGAALASVASFFALALVLQALLFKKFQKILPFMQIIPAFAAAMVSLPVFLFFKECHPFIRLFAGGAISLGLYAVAVAALGIVRRSEIERLVEGAAKLPEPIRSMVRLKGKIFSRIARK